MHHLSFYMKCVHNSGLIYQTTPYFYLLSLSIEATKLQEKLTKLERQSSVRDAMIEISNEISGFQKQHAKSLGSASISVNMEEINVVENKPAQISP